MDEGTRFLIAAIMIVISILIILLFYFAALRRLFIPPTPSLAFVLAIFLIGSPGILLVYIWGWIQHRSMRLTQLMIAWTIAIGVFVGQIVALNLLDGRIPQTLALAIRAIALFFICLLAVHTLIPFLRADERMRALMRNSSLKNIKSLAELKDQAIPNLRLMLEDEYVPYRLDAIDCLARIGPSAIPILKEVSNQGDTEEAIAAQSVLTDLGAI